MLFMIMLKHAAAKALSLHAEMHYYHEQHYNSNT